MNSIFARPAILAATVVLIGAIAVRAEDAKRVPVIVDTDIGTFIDDAYALALILASPEYQPLAFTTCTGQAEDRAWMVGRWLTALDIRDVPVAYGTNPQPKSEIDWQIQYRRHAAVVWNRTVKPVKEPAQDVMARVLKEHKDGVTILALGPLTNVARLLEKHSEAKEAIAKIVIAGGRFQQGDPEWNIKQDTPAAQTVFAAGIPLVVAPVDAAAMLKLPVGHQQKLFAANTPLVYDLRNLAQLCESKDETPMLHDALAARMGFDPSCCTTRRVRIQVDDDGHTRIVDGEPNATIVVKPKVEPFLDDYVAKLAAFGKPVLPPELKNVSKVIERRGLPRVVHAFEDFDNDIEKRWWMSGKEELKDVPEGKRRVCRAVLTQDFDDLQGDMHARYQAVVFNPVPGPPMGPKTRLSFRYKLSGSDEMRVQLYSLSNGYHRYLSLKDLPQDKWTEGTVDMTQMRRPDGSGGALAADERIDDIQFYVDPRAELLIDYMILYDEADEGETRAFPKRLLFSGIFDTGKQGQEWPGEFEIVPNEKPRTWKAAKSVVNKETGKPWIRLNLRGERRLAPKTELRFSYRLKGADSFAVQLVNSKSEWKSENKLSALKQDEWAQASVPFDLRESLSDISTADEIHFLLPEGAELLIDDLLLYEPGEAK